MDNLVDLDHYRVIKAKAKSSSKQIVMDQAVQEQLTEVIEGLSTLIERYERELKKFTAKKSYLM